HHIRRQFTPALFAYPVRPDQFIDRLRGKRAGQASHRHPISQHQTRLDQPEQPKDAVLGLEGPPGFGYKRSTALRARHAGGAVCKRRPRRLWLDDRHFQRRVLDPALTEARLCGHTAAGPDATHRRCWDGGCDSRRHRVRKGSPNDARHTAASQLVIDGKSLYKVQKLLGHESPQTTQRYAHLEPEQYDDFQDAWSTSSNAVTHGLTHEEATESGSRRLL